MSDECGISIIVTVVVIVGVGVGVGLEIVSVVVADEEAVVRDVKDKRTQAAVSCIVTV